MKLWKRFAAMPHILHVVLLVGIGLMAGCATGVHMTDDEAKACRADPKGCSVWTDDELTALARRVFVEGFQRGKEAERKSL